MGFTFDRITHALMSSCGPLDQSCVVEDLPNEILWHIFTMLDYPSLVNTYLVNKKWQEISAQKILETHSTLDLHAQHIAQTYFMVFLNTQWKEFCLQGGDMHIGRRLADHHCKENPKLRMVLAHLDFWKERRMPNEDIYASVHEDRLTMRVDVARLTNASVHESNIITIAQDRIEEKGSLLMTHTFGCTGSGFIEKKIQVEMQKQRIKIRTQKFSPVDPCVRQNAHSFTTCMDISKKKPRCGDLKALEEMIVMVHRIVSILYADLVGNVKKACTQRQANRCDEYMVEDHEAWNNLRLITANRESLRALVKKFPHQHTLSGFAHHLF